MSELDYYKLPQFVDRVAKGFEGPQLPVRISNMYGNQTHNISFLDHCDELCKKHNTDRLRLLSVIQQKLNGDMIVRLNDSPVFKNKVENILEEWGENIDPNDLFRCPNDCYDNNSFDELRNLYKTHNDTLESLNLNAEDLEHGIYNSVENLKNEYYTCENMLRDSLSEIETRQPEYEPKYRAILCDLSTRQKPFYLDQLMQSEDQANMIQHVNRKVNRHIPDNINIIFMNIVLIPTLISKEMERLKHESHRMKEEIEKRQRILADIIERIGPDEPVSLGFLKMLSDLTGVFSNDTDDENLPDDDIVDTPEEDKIEKVMQNLVDTNKDSMYYLDVKPENNMIIQESEIDTESSVSSKKDDSIPSEISFY
jgi:hypothetical protein